MSLDQLPFPCWILYHPLYIYDEEHHPSGPAAHAAAAALQAEQPEQTHGLIVVQLGVPCWVATCQHCGDLAREADSGATHFSDPADLADITAEWRTDRTGNPATCPTCATNPARSLTSGVTR